jgi:hypothetical protein
MIDLKLLINDKEICCDNLSCNELASNHYEIEGVLENFFNRNQFDTIRAIVNGVESKQFEISTFKRVGNSGSKVKAIIRL